MDILGSLLRFLNQLEAWRISYRLEHFREDTLMVTLSVPGERWDVEFFADGNIELEIFGSSSEVSSTSMEELIKRLEKHSG